MNVFNFAVKKGADGSKHLDLQIHGEIDGGWGDAESVSTAQEIARLNEHADAKTVHVRINSFGGSAFGGVAMYNALQSHPGDVTCTVEGIAASAASLIAMAGKTCMGVGSMLMIHPPATIAIGKADDLRKTADILDKVQEAIGGIYTAKTGKSAEDIDKLVDEETWMTADEAVAAGFADEMSEGDGPTVEDVVAAGNEHRIMINGVAFVAGRLPAQILAMAKAHPPAPAPPAPPALALVPPPEPQPPITRAELALRSPDLVAALLAEGQAAGVAAERARLQSIDELGIAGCSDLVAAAKYGDKPSDAPALAMAIVKAGKLAGAEFLALRRTESRPVADVVPGTPDQTQAAAQARHIQAMTDGGNARRGGAK